MCDPLIGTNADNTTKTIEQLEKEQSVTRLRELFIIESGRIGGDDSELFSTATDAAMELIIMAGYDAQDSDSWGDEMSDTVQTLLTLAMFRCPQLAERILGLDDDIRITSEAI